MSDQDPVLSEPSGDGVTVITINRPHAMNALDGRAMDALAAAFEAFEAASDQRVAVLTGAGGRAFCAGGDLKEMAARAAAGEPAFGPRRVEDMVATRIELGSKPAIAAIDGVCVANGLELALACDIRVATLASTFGLPEVARGLLAGPGLVSLRTRIPRGEALLLHLTGETMDAERAHAVGLVQVLRPDREGMFDEALRIARVIAAHDPATVATIRRLVNGRDEDVDARIRRQIDEVSGEVAVSDTVRAQLTAFANHSPAR